MFIVFQPRLLIPIEYSLSQFTMSLLYPLLPCLVSIFIVYDVMPVILLWKEFKEFVLNSQL